MSLGTSAKYKQHTSLSFVVAVAHTFAVYNDATEHHDYVKFIEVFWNTNT